MRAIEQRVGTCNQCGGHYVGVYDAEGEFFDGSPLDYPIDDYCAACGERPTEDCGESLIYPV